MSVRRDEPPPLDGEVLRWYQPGPRLFGREWATWYVLTADGREHVRSVHRDDGDDGGDWQTADPRGKLLVGAPIESNRRLAAALVERDRELAEAVKLLKRALAHRLVRSLRGDIDNWLDDYDARRAPAASTAPAEAANGDEGRST